MLALRSYQIQARDRAVDAVRRGKNPLIAMATGTGKTEVGLAVAVARQGNGGRVLWIAHRKELVDQPVARIDHHWPELQPAGVFIAGRGDPGARFIAATIQTLVVGKGLDRLLAAGGFDLVVIDEAHHAAAASYRKVIQALPGVPRVGLTATPRRADRESLRVAFDEVAFRLSLVDAVNLGCLVPPLGYAVDLGYEISQARLDKVLQRWAREAGK